MTELRHPRHERLLYWIFFASGFAGLIYESIWTHYLKLFLGHSAYAQVLVLGIFMAGMAAGAALAARVSERIRRPLAAYARVEAAIGCLALVFHPVFNLATGGFYEAGLAASFGPGGFAAAKWALAAALILPQSILLGATFPLFAAAVIRAGGTGRGRTIAILYFANSLGGALGVLLAGFVLVPAIGLPGTIAAAGAVNLLIALASSRLAAAVPVAMPLQPAEAPKAVGKVRLTAQGWFLLGVAFFTGASSFIYEIGWIRMLSLVLGSASHAFELMLSAFITGLAFGGLWIRKRIDTAAAPAMLLGYIQLAMGGAAIATLPLHNLSFDLVAWLLQAAPKNDGGYALFNLVRYGISALIMFPAAFCAGMTLPLVTRILCAHAGQQERAIGLVYSANTLGAISGLAFAVMIGLPLVGLNYLVGLGALLDVALGAALLLVYGGAGQWRLATAATAFSALGTVLAASSFDPQKLVSGVFRSGKSAVEGRVVEIAHGRTATISTEIGSNGAVVIRTNGKQDASAMRGLPPQYQLDEVTMTLLGAIPLMLHPRPAMVANIGFGSGITGQTLLGDPRVERLDTIEIEPQMVALARRFSGRNERLYADPRSQIHIDDAKAYFAAAGRRYDLIVSEPSNPWVSGVAGLFSVEFYRHAVRHMAPDGLFAQWLQIYETHPERVASVLKAVGEVFDDYLVVALDVGDILIVARPQGRIVMAQEDSQRLSPQIQSWLRRLEISGPSDLTIRIMGNKALFAPWLAQQPVPANSDFHPYIDTHADRDRFIGGGAAMQGIALSAFPIPELFGIRPPLEASVPLSLNPHFGPEPPARFARLIADPPLFDAGHLFPGTPPAQLSAWQRQTQQLLADCADPPLNDAAYAISGLLIKVLPYLSPTEGRALIKRMGPARCLVAQDEHQKAWLGLLDQLLERSPAGIGAAAAHLLDDNQGATPVRARYLLGMALLGYLAAADAAHAQDIWTRHAARAIGGGQPLGIELQVLRDSALAPAATPARAIGQ